MRAQHTELLSRFLPALRDPRRLTGKLKTRLQTLVLGPLLCRFRRGNIVMFHIGRSGSTVLGDLLRQHPQVFWDSEIYQRLLRDRDKNGTLYPSSASPGDAPEYLRARMPRAGKRFYGFEVKFFHLRRLNVQLSHYVGSLRCLGFTHFVILAQGLSRVERRPGKNPNLLLR